MAKETNNSNVFKKARIKAEILESLFERLEEELKDTSRYYGKTGVQKQKERYNREIGDYEKVFDENGEPEMEDVYDYIPYTEDEMKDRPDALLKAEVIKDVISELEDLL